MVLGEEPRGRKRVSPTSLAAVKDSTALKNSLLKNSNVSASVDVGKVLHLP